ncbi:MAG: DUF2231 domain-containing protein [Candidatus Eremiobacteraeota bacterium]|nr:DUF2231 domain-containing protein [Candidatus Eremiobacteraeota bacterium]
MPIGCFVAAVVADVVSIWTGPAFFPAMATWLIAFGVVGALIAAMAGIVDYLSAPMTEAAKGIAAWHMVLNIGVIVIFGAEFALRYGHYTSSGGYVLEGVGIVVLAISGTLGGNVAHRHLVGSSERDLGVPRRAADLEGLSPEERIARDREVAQSSRKGTI